MQDRIRHRHVLTYRHPPESTLLVTTCEEFLPPFLKKVRRPPFLKKRYAKEALKLDPSDRTNDHITHLHAILKGLEVPAITSFWP